MTFFNHNKGVVYLFDLMFTVTKAEQSLPGLLYLENREPELILDLATL